MKLSEIPKEKPSTEEETVEESVSGTSVTSVGNIEYTTAGNGKINIRKRLKDDEDQEIVETIATIERQKDGWKFKQKPSWNNNNLPHMGHINNRKLSNRGLKTNELNLESTLKELGIKYDKLSKGE